MASQRDTETVEAAESCRHAVAGRAQQRRLIFTRNTGFCGALKWKEEAAGMCCLGGKVVLPSIDEPVEPLKEFFSYKTSCWEGSWKGTTATSNIHKKHRVGGGLFDKDFCGALKWKEEAAGMCCLGGKVVLPSIDEPVEPLKEFFSYKTDELLGGKLEGHNSDV
ncbi:hypothetical protein TNCV_4565731 [Trichonephila clavipes]|nr:hypothetical protein TNCV_4565731 [Trichonephila clavipes]